MPFDTAATLDVQQSIRIKELSGGVNVLNQQVAALSGITANATRLNVQLLGVIPAAAGQIYYTSEAIAGTGKGGGAWVAIADATTPDNGGTIRRPDANWIWKKQLQEGKPSVYDFGATGLGVADDTFAILGCIAAVLASGGGDVIFPAGNYRTTATIVIPQGVKLRGAGSIATRITADFDGDAISADGVLVTRIDGMVIGPGSGKEIVGVHLTDVSKSFLHDVKIEPRLWGGTIYCPRIGFLLTGACYYNKGDLLDVSAFDLAAGSSETETRGIKLEPRVSDGEAPNTNTFHFVQLVGSDCTGGPGGGGTYVESGKDSVCIDCWGNFNTFEVGELACARYAIKNWGSNFYFAPSFIESIGYQSWHLGGGIMHCETMYQNVTPAGCEPQIDDGILLGSGGALLDTMFQATNQAELSDSGLLALWTFDRAESVIIDRTGNGNNILLTGTPTLVKGLHRDVLQLSPTKTIDPFSTAAFSLTDGFTLVISHAITSRDPTHPFLFEVYPTVATNSYLEASLSVFGGGLSVDGISDVPLIYTWGAFTMAYAPTSANWITHAVYFNPTTGKFGVYNMFSMAYEEKTEGSGGVVAGFMDAFRHANDMYLFRLQGDSGTDIMTGSIDCMAIYNRKLDLREVVEWSQHRRPPSYFGRSPTSDEGPAAPLGTNWPTGWYRHNNAAASGQPRGWYFNGAVWTADSNLP